MKLYDAQGLAAFEDAGTALDVQVGELLRIATRLDKAGFAKLYATSKTEEAAMDARLQYQLESFANREPQGGHE